MVITAEAQSAAEPPAGQLYQTEPPALKPVPLTAIPYYAWDNRAPGEMQVWLPESHRRPASYFGLPVRLGVEKSQEAREST